MLLNTSDYKCKKCDKVIEYQKKYGEDFPDTIICDCADESDEQHGIMVRIYSKPTTDIAPGYSGNGNNGYNPSTVYESSRFTPMNILQSKQKRSDSGL